MEGPLQDRSPRTDPIPLRAHNLLCLQGFRGMGYDEAFTANMARLHRALGAAPATRVRIVAEPDHLCAACPHVDRDRGCRLGGKPHEEHMRAQDADVAARLDLAPGRVVTWREILARIGERIEPADLGRICTTCPWLPLGTCAEGIAGLEAARQVARRAAKTRGKPSRKRRPA